MSTTTTLHQLVETFIGNTDKTKRDSSISDIIDKINDAPNILPLIVVLGEFLTSSTSNTQRQDSILIIYKVLKECNNLQLNLSALTTIITFLCSRLEHDLECQSFIILTLCVLYNTYHSALSSHNNSELLIKIMTTIITKLDYEQIKLKVRYKNSEMNVNYNQLCREQYLKVLHHSIHHYTDVMLNRLTSDELFIDGAIKLMDGESDPRNIMLSFNLYQSIFAHYPHHIISKHIRNLFEIMEVYFPIEFNAPNAKKDVFGITKDDLSNGLNACFGCNPLLSSFVLDMILEKLDADEVVADKQQMIDILKSLKCCCNAYGVTVIQSYLKEIYEKTKAFILYGSDGDIYDTVLELIASLVCAICDAKTQQNIGYYNAEMTMQRNTNDISIDNVNCVGWTTFLEPFINDFRAEIKIPDAKLARMSGEIIITISGACFKSFRVILKHLWNDLVTKYEATKANKELISQTHALLEVMSSIWIGAKDIINANHLDIKLYYKVFLNVFVNCNTDDDIHSKCIAMIALSYLCDIPSLLSNEDITQIVSIIYKQFEAIIQQSAAASDDDEKQFKKLEEYKEIIYNALSRISNTNCDIVLDIFVNGILTYLQIKADVSDTSIDINTLKVLMDWMAPLCLDNNYIFHYVLKIVMQPLCLCTANIRDSMDTMKDIKSCFDKLCIILDHNDSTRAFEKGFMDEFLTQMVVNYDWELADTESEYGLALVINNTVGKLIANSPQETQIKFAKHCIDDLMNNGNTNRYKLWMELTCVASCNALDTGAISLEFMVHLQKLLLSMSYDIGIERRIMNYYFECMACIVNKWKSNALIASYLHSNEFESLWNNKHNNRKTDAQMALHLYYIVFIIKALCVRCYRDKSQQILQQLIGFLCECLLSQNTRIAQIASCGFDIIMNDKAALILNKKNKCNVSCLYKQKFFVQTIEYIMKELSVSSDKEQIYLLFAVCHLMKNVPNAVLRLHLSQLLPLMIESFKSSQQNLRISILYLFEVLLQSNLECVTSYIETIIPILLELTQCRKAVKARVSALQCLIYLTDLEYKLVHSNARQVIKSLLEVVDDEKKEVRVIAVECRNKWYLLHQK